jgi:copper homeostasis protein
VTLVEACVQSLGSAVRAERAGAHRIELCADLAVGGVTPSAGLLRATRSRLAIPIHVLIRPRGGSFRYDEGEVEAMLYDIAEARRSGADGVVIGALTPEGMVDRAITGRLVEAARPLAVTFHRAIDDTPDLDQAFRVLLELGIDRVLTAGGVPTAESGIPALAGLVHRFGPEITILAGGRVRAANARRIVVEARVPEVHLGPRLADSGELDVPALEAALRELT